MSISRLIIATRKSPLALWQAEHVKAMLERAHAGLRVELLGMTTEGDRILDRPLADIGGKGLFIKELEVALADGRADLAVHSMKDVPAHVPEPFEIMSVDEREDARDAWVSPKFASPAELPHGARVGTASLRRMAQLKERFAHLVIEPVRGNLATRLRKLDEGQYDALVLAAAGLTRLGLGERIRQHLSIEDSIPAIGQGVLGVEFVAGRADVRAALAPLTRAEVAACVRTERAMGEALGASCNVPVAGHCTRVGDTLTLRGLLASIDGSHVVRHTAQAPVEQAVWLGRDVARVLSERHAARASAPA